VVWERDEAGNYFADISSFGFSSDKIVIQQCIVSYDVGGIGDSEKVQISRWFTGTPTFYQRVLVRVTNLGGSGMDGYVDGLPIEILVYP